MEGKAAWFRYILVGIAIKELCSALYFSTDMQVHKHWISLVGNKNWEGWYTDESSIWTLDYPPLFAVFQYILFLLIKLSYKTIDGIPWGAIIKKSLPEINKLLVYPATESNTEQTNFIMRQTVIISEFLFIIALLLYKNISFFLNLHFFKFFFRRYCWKKKEVSGNISAGFLIFFLSFMNVGLIAVDSPFFIFSRISFHKYLHNFRRYSLPI